MAAQLLPYTLPSPVEWTEVDDALVHVAQQCPQLRVIFQTLEPERSEERFYLVWNVIADGLPKYLAATGRLGVIYGSEWKEDPEFGGALKGDVSERWSNVLDARPFFVSRVDVHNFRHIRKYS
ncbi:hypothetical protein SCP_0600690 [Sparassis crispa]|uniref:Uncharacterized protein n=1 Tax=Sparassis crispa TaxID=139825 RepID=A0A401GPC3_9APHY|nr:hypothetical protein SCP_0600690 [Sparassis crispa]GBE84091.1 hypothetical protein SCP_0600690 [Sparassis crispa]